MRFCLVSLFVLARLTFAADLRQNWSAEIQQKYAFTSQGSKLIPYDWALALPRADDDVPFFTSSNLKNYGYLTEPASRLNPDGLPVGFMKDEAPGGFTRLDAWRGRVPTYAGAAQLGISCAACHTSELSYRGQKLRVFGAPSFSNFQLFVEDMDRAVANVAVANEGGQANYDRFRTFARVVARRMGMRATPPFVTRLRHDLAEFYGQRVRWEQFNGHARAGMDYGPMRNDAFGVIFNQSLASFPNLPENARVPNAPVKYPVLWDTPYHEVVQWLGLARNAPEAGGPIARNLGQVLGVFGHSDVAANSWIKGYCTSAKRRNLNDLETWVRDLRSPAWPARTFGFDVARAERGQVVYQQNCVGCHALNERAPADAAAHLFALGASRLIVSNPPTRDVKRANERMVALSEVRTDATVYDNAVKRTAFTGELEGRHVKVLSGRPLEKIEPAVTLLRHIVAGSILGSFSWMTCANTRRDRSANFGLAEKVAKQVFHFTAEDTDLPDLDARMSSFADTLGKYKARALNGIWAAPPYLHNGSVRSLRQLLTRAADREPSFAFSCNEFDPVEVGIDCRTVTADNRVTAVDFTFDTTRPANSNRGHEYGVDLDDAAKLDLIEYIKAL